MNELNELEELENSSLRAPEVKSAVPSTAPSIDLPSVPSTSVKQQVIIPLQTLFEVGYCSNITFYCRQRLKLMKRESLMNLRV